VLQSKRLRWNLEKLRPNPQKSILWRCNEILEHQSWMNVTLGWSSQLKNIFPNIMNWKMYFRTRKRHGRVFKKIVTAPLITIYEYYMNHTVFKMKPLLLLIVLSSSISLTNFQNQKWIFLLCFYHNLQLHVILWHSFIQPILSPKDLNAKR
jgi:hypothetical protein